MIPKRGRSSRSFSLFWVSEILPAQKYRGEYEHTADNPQDRLADTHRHVSLHGNDPQREMDNLTIPQTLCRRLLQIRLRFFRRKAKDDPPGVSRRVRFAQSIL